MSRLRVPLDGTDQQPDATSRHDHPLSPSSRPPVAHRSSKAPSQPPSYFDASAGDIPDPTRRKANATEADLLGVGPSRRLGTVKAPLLPRNGQDDSLGTSTAVEMERSRSGKPWKVYLQSLSKEELAIVETDFEAMSEQELQSYLEAFTPPAPTLAGEPPSREDDISPLPALSTETPPSDPQHLSPNGGLGQPLFPPSPPGTTRPELVDHPLRILSRAVRELKESVERLEKENERLRTTQPGVGRNRRNRHADQVSNVPCLRAASLPDLQLSIHEGLTEALSTSLDTDTAVAVGQPLGQPVAYRAASLRTSSPAPTLPRSKSPAPSVKTLPITTPYSTAGPSLYSTKSAEPPTQAESGKRNQSNRSSWTAGLWVWSGGAKPKAGRSRKGSIGSVVSQAGTLGDVAESEGVRTMDMVPGDEEESWRKGDGGSTPAFAAIVLATVSLLLHHATSCVHGIGAIAYHPADPHS
jgi:hypothetical protein